MEYCFYNTPKYALSGNEFTLCSFSYGIVFARSVNKGMGKRANGGTRTSPAAQRVVRDIKYLEPMKRKDYGELASLHGNFSSVPQASLHGNFRFRSASVTPQ